MEDNTLREARAAFNYAARVMQYDVSAVRTITCSERLPA
jgi:hypothetical protein